LALRSPAPSHPLIYAFTNFFIMAKFLVSPHVFSHSFTCFRSKFILSCGLSVAGCELNAVIFSNMPRPIITPSTPYSCALSFASCAFFTSPFPIIVVAKGCKGCEIPFATDSLNEPLWQSHPNVLAHQIFPWQFSRARLKRQFFVPTKTRTNLR